MTGAPSGRATLPRAPHWERYARDWDLLGTPLRPAAEDVAIYERAVAAWQAGHARGPRALLLGVTPEIATMGWPRGTQLVAIDRSAAMIAWVWPARAREHGAAVRGDWLNLPLADASQDVVIGDSPLHQRYPHEQRAALQSFHRVLSRDGLLVVRYFCAPDRAEDPKQVFDDLLAGRIGSFHAFKWRLAMALQRSAEEGVAWGAIWDAWHAWVRDPEAMMRARRWPVAQLRTIDVYQGASARISFPTYAEAKALLAETFDPAQTIVPGYELGERCPIVIARPR